jgi:hypothetical protein
MILIAAGALLAGLGLLSAALLLAAPLGWTADPGLSLWVLFPLFTLLGYSLLVVGGRDPSARLSTRALALPLLLLAGLAAIGLVVGAAGILPLHGGSAPLWYVLVLGGVIGAIGSAVSRRPGAA